MDSFQNEDEIMNDVEDAENVQNEVDEDGEDVVFDSNYLNEHDVIQLVSPKCDEQYKPVEGLIFNTLDEGVSFYKKYAYVCGFQTRKSTLVKGDDKSVRTRYIVCSREGLRKMKQIVPAEEKADESVQKRPRLSARCDCMARCVFQVISGNRYKVITFNEAHTHDMVEKEDRYLMTSHRNVDPVHQMFLINGMKANIGLMKSFRLYKELVGGYDKVGCTSVDFKNYACDLREFAKGVVAQLLLDNFKTKQDNGGGFKYYYELDKSAKLKRLFWADEIAIKNFSMFGEAVSYDATYGTNRYKMIFTPFTGKDNHGSCVSFGAALISCENVDSYSWVLQKFIECMGTHPIVMTTDMDPALKKAIVAVMPNTSHRYCMWHIMMKVCEKLTGPLRDDSEFKSKLDNIVWSDLDEPHVFEGRWLKLMDDYKINEHRWFTDMFKDRKFWIPAFFRDIRISGLFRTTSYSESENSFFKRYLNKGSDIAQVYMHYECAMDSQRNTHRTLSMADDSGAPTRLTQLPIERHAASLFTNKIFKDVQVEIVSADNICVMVGMTTEGGENICYVDDTVGAICRVCHNTVDDSFSCPCKLFIRKGIICRHILYVMKNLKMKKIPDKFIEKRWTKTSLIWPPVDKKQTQIVIDENSFVGNNRFLVVMGKCIAYVNGSEELGDKLYAEMSAMEKRFASLALKDNTKQNAFEQYYGSKVPEETFVASPDESNTKGSGVGGRRLTDRERGSFKQRSPNELARSVARGGGMIQGTVPRKTLHRDL